MGWATQVQDILMWLLGSLDILFMLYDYASSAFYNQANHISPALELITQHYGTSSISEHPIVAVSLPSHLFSTTIAALGFESELGLKSRVR